MLKAKTKNVLLVVLSLVFALTLISFVAVRPVKAETPIISMKDVASVRVDPDGKNGIRFTGYVADSVNLSQAVEGEFSETDTYAGIIVAREELSASELTHAVLDAKDYIDVPAVKYDPQNDTLLGKAFNAVIYKIPEESLAQQLTARAYVRINGEYTYSETVTTRSLAGVASSSILKDNPTNEDLEILKGYVSAVNPTIKIGETELVANGTTQISLQSFESAEITVSPKDIAYSVNVEKDSTGLMIEGNVLTAIGGTEKQSLYVDMAGDFYEVEVSVSEWKDTNLKENALYDFNEMGYVTKIKSLDPERPAVPTFIAGEEAEVLGSSDGLLHVKAQSYGEIEFDFDEPVVVKECGGIYLRMMMDIEPTTARLANVYISFKKADGTYTTSTYIDQYVKTFASYKANQMFTLYAFKQGDIKDAPLASELAKIDKVYGVKFGSYSVTDGSGSHVNFWFDEIGVLKLGEGQTELVSFDTKDEIDLVWRRWTPQPTVLLPTDAGYPADKGATTGVLSVPRDNGTGPMHYFLKDRVELVPGDKIVIRVYVPKVNDETTATFNILLNRANDNVNGYDYNAGIVIVERGTFQDIVIEVREAIATAVANGNGDLNTIAVQRKGFVGTAGEQGADAEWYMDSISYIKGDGAIVKLGSTTLSKDGDNEITLTPNQKVNVTVEPSSLEFTVTGNENNTGLTVTDNVINTGVANADKQYVYVKVGENTYTVAIIVERWLDPSIEANVIADFNESGYTTAITNPNEDFPIIVTSITGDSAVALGSSDGVLHVKARAYGEFEFNFAEPVTVADCAGLYFRMRTDIGLYNNRFIHAQVSFKKADGTYTTATYFDQYARTNTQYAPNEMFTFYTFKQGDIQDSAQASTLASVDKVYGIKFSSYSDPVNGAEFVNFYLDEFGTMKLKENETELISFNDKYDANLVWGRWTSDLGVLLPTDEGFPVDKGATTGVMRLAKNGNSVHYYLRDRVKLAVGDKLIARVYVPSIEGVETATIAIQFNRALTNINGNEYDAGTFTINRGAFVDIEIEITEAMVTAINNAQGNLNTLRLWQSSPNTADTYYYVDSISYVKKTA